MVYVSVISKQKNKDWPERPRVSLLEVGRDYSLNGAFDKKFLILLPLIESEEFHKKQPYCLTR